MKGIKDRLNSRVDTAKENFSKSCNLGQNGYQGESIVRLLMYIPDHLRDDGIFILKRSFDRPFGKLKHETGNNVLHD